MHRALLFAIAAAFFVLLGCARSQTVPGAVHQAAVCKIAPRIDGIEGPGEWTAANRVEIDLQMKSGKGEVRPTRRAGLSLMNSAANLYVALRVPDASREMSTSPVMADGAILAFSRGDHLAAGDDRRVLLPGAFADKHFVAAGKDADDPQKHGQGAMVWRKTPAGGEYWMEWQLPLNSGDQNDIAAAPGSRLRFNILYLDRFNFSGADMELGGLFGPTADNATNWATLALAQTAQVEAPAPVPEWLAKLFPHTGAPGRSSLTRLRRLDAGETGVGEATAGAVIVEVKYPALDGRDEIGKARLFLPPILRTDPKRRVPLIHRAGYELDEASAAPLLAKGYAVSTPYAHPLNPLSRGVNLDRAILHAVSALPFVDPLRVAVSGGSAGGWMTLMLSADAFPLVWSMPEVPPLHWGYNAAYFLDNKERAAAAPGSTTPRLPVLNSVTSLAEQSRTLYGMPVESPTFLAVSSLAHLESITAPTLVTFTTADMLVPIDQVGADLVSPHDPKLFPEGFTRAIPGRIPGVNGKHTLLDLLPVDRYQLFRIPRPEKPTRLGAAPAMPLNLPFSRTRDWSIVILDEGPVEPNVGHFKYAWALDHEPFRKWAEDRGVTVDQLTQPKLERLMQRMKGEPWRPAKIRPASLNKEILATQLDYPEAERRDVIRGLRAFCAGRGARGPPGVALSQAPAGSPASR
jgi:hypothetical protein